MLLCIVNFSFVMLSAVRPVEVRSSLYGLNPEHRSGFNLHHKSGLNSDHILGLNREPRSWKKFSKEEFGLRNAFHPWSGRRLDYLTSKRSTGSGKRAPLSSWASKRSARDLTPHSSWAGKRSGNGYFPGKRAPFSSWAGKRSGKISWAGKRAPFSSWAGKRSGGP